ncbi:hypothetical protein [Candidatus Magnetaquicoccus inordinatus]|uniref:hypothetical protein n=1 Tax=Candidatus Magnetaquicoccus inordinatus TaxID=2496818 RepID=UPI00102C2A72|nr:hypothetical protein [Candidatus Magnetaquicoccus inordinatus]
MPDRCQRPCQENRATPQEYAETIFALCDQSAAQRPPPLCWYQLGSLSIEVRLLGQAQAQHLLQAMAHQRLFEPPQKVDYRIEIWEEVSQDLPFPAPYWQVHEFGERGELPGFVGPQLYGRYDLGSETLLLYDQNRRRALYWCRQVEKLPYWEFSFPLRQILHWLLLPTPWQPLHAAAVGLPEKGAILLVGPSGSGKSTTSLSCLEEGLGYVGDDFVLTGLPEATNPLTSSLYHWGKLTRDGMRRLPSLAQLSLPMRQADQEKAIVSVLDCWPERVMRQATLRAIMIPQLHDAEESWLHPSSAGAALRALAPTTLMTLSGGGAQTMRKLRALCAALPAWQLGVGQNPRKVALLLRSWLEKEHVTAQ